MEDALPDRLRSDLLAARKRRDAAAELRTLGQDAAADRLEAEAAVLDAYLT